METNGSLDKKKEKKMQFKENDNFKNIKSDYFLKKIFLNNSLFFVNSSSLFFIILSFSFISFCNLAFSSYNTRRTFYYFGYLMFCVFDE